jgi:predicted alpha/beta-fold hydrolase
MWEALATTQRQDRVLHGAAKLLNLAVGFIALPLWLLGQRLRDPFRRVLARLDSERPALPVPAPRERSMDALMADLEAIPNHLHRSDAALVRKGLADISTFVLAQQREAANLGYAYPEPFSDHVFEGADGEHIAASVGMQGTSETTPAPFGAKAPHQHTSETEPAPFGAKAPHQTTGRPALIVVHGLFSSRRFDYVRQIAVRAYFEWGFNVLAVDLRTFGMTNLTSQAPTTAGWKEGEDIVAAARYLKELGATTVGAIGISLGGSAVLGACHVEGAEDALDGGIIAISPPADAKAMAKRLSVRLPRSHPAYAINQGFWAMLVSRVRESRWEGIEGFVDPIERISAPYYDLEPDELWRLAAAREHIGAARVPVLILHPEDDAIIPVDHARMLVDAARDNDLVRVWILAGGGHGAIDAVDRVWFYAVLRGFFERWAGYERRERAGAPPTAANRENANLIYSAAR